MREKEGKIDATERGNTQTRTHKTHHARGNVHYFCFGGQKLDHLTLLSYLHASVAICDSLPLIKYSQLVPLNIHCAALLRLSALHQPASSECTRSPPKALKKKKGKTHARSVCVVMEEEEEMGQNSGKNRQLDQKVAKREMRHIRGTPDEGMEHEVHPSAGSCSVRAEKPCTSIIQQ